MSLILSQVVLERGFGHVEGVGRYLLQRPEQLPILWFDTVLVTIVVYLSIRRSFVLNHGLLLSSVPARCVESFLDFRAVFP